MPHTKTSTVYVIATIEYLGFPFTASLGSPANVIWQKSTPNGVFYCHKRHNAFCAKEKQNYKEDFLVEFFNSAVDVLQTLVIALGAGLGVWGVINLLEGYGNDNPGAKSQGMKQLMAGGGVALIGMLLVPQLTGLFG